MEKLCDVLLFCVILMVVRLTSASKAPTILVTDTEKQLRIHMCSVLKSQRIISGRVYISDIIMSYLSFSPITSILCGDRPDHPTISPNKRWLLHTDTTTVYLSDVTTGRCEYSFSTNSRISSVTIATDQSWFVTGDFQGDITIWAIKSGTGVSHLSGHTRVVNIVRMYDRDNQLVSGSEDNTIRVWNLQRQSCTRIFRQNLYLFELIVSSNNQYIFVSSYWAKEIRVWDIEMGICVQILKEYNQVGSFQVSPDNRYIVSFAFRITVWDTSTWHPCAVLPTNAEYSFLHSAGTSSERHFAGIGHGLGSTYVFSMWAWNTYECIRTIQFEHRVRCVSFDDEFLIMASKLNSGDAYISRIEVHNLAPEKTTIRKTSEDDNSYQINKIRLPKNKKYTLFSCMQLCNKKK